MPPLDLTDLCAVTLTRDSQRQNAAVLHALTVGALKRDAAANLHVVFLRRFLVRHRGAPRVVGRVLLQDVASSDHHSRRLRWDQQEVTKSAGMSPGKGESWGCSYLYTVEGSALLLVQQRVVVGQLHQLVQFFFWVFLLQLLQDTDHLEQRGRGGGRGGRDQEQATARPACSVGCSQPLAYCH